MLKSFSIRFIGIATTLFLLVILPEFISNQYIKALLLYITIPINNLFKTDSISSDSKEMYQLLLFILSISVIIALLVALLTNKKSTENEKLNYWLTSFYSYILSFFLLVYGFNKLFKVQFFTPEPNTLFTPVGLLSKDILFWTSMGSSYNYNLFMGIIEIIPALLLFFSRTRMLGGLIALAVLINVFMINIGFDISVKILSTFLIFIALLILKPYTSSLLSFFFQLKKSQSNNCVKIVSSKKQIMVKNTLICFILFDTLSPYFLTNNFNDDKQQRPLFHGAYEIIASESTTNYPIFGNSKKIKRMFIHRKNYFIVQFQDDSMQDFVMKKDLIKNQFKIYTSHGICTLQVFHNSFLLTANHKKTLIKSRKINLKKLPLLNDNFHLVSEI